MRSFRLFCLWLAVAAPGIPAVSSKSMMYKEEEWIIHGVSRSCGSDGCVYGHHGSGSYRNQKNHQQHQHQHDEYGHKNGQGSWHECSDGYQHENGHESRPKASHYDPESYGWKNKEATTSHNGNAGPIGGGVGHGGRNVTVGPAKHPVPLDKKTKHSHDSCRWTFTVVTQKHGRQRCSFEAGRQATVVGVACGRHFSVSSGWSGQFGEGQGFTTLSVIDGKRRLIVWPAYRDVQLDEQRVVKPDQSYTPQHLP